MSSVIGALRVNLGLDSAQFTKGAKDAQKSLGGLKVALAATGAAVAAAGVAMAAMARTGAADIDRAAKAARRLETSIAGFRALELAAGEAGVSVGSLADAVQTMDREVAKGSKGATAALTQLGLAARDLSGLEADQKIALIADRIAGLGLSSGEASAVLQGLGIRSREFVLAVQSGGDALRQARRDVEDYGLAVSEVDSARIEAANDAIGRLSLIGKKLSQELGLALVPAMGELATAMTDSLREGGLLRGGIEALAAAARGSVGAVRAVAENLDAVASVAIGLAATQIPALVLGLTAATGGLGVATIASNALTASLGYLRVAIMAVGGPWGLLAGAIASAAAYFLVFGDNAAEAETAAYDVRDAERALRDELEAYATSSSPAAREESRKRVIAHKENAIAALEAARAELALRAAIEAKGNALLDQNPLTAGGNSGYAEAMRERTQAAEAEVARIEALIRDMTQALKDMDASGGGGATVIPEPKEVAATTAEVKKLGAAGGAAGKKLKDGMDGAKKGADEFAEALRENVVSSISSEVTGAVDWMLDGFKGGFRGLLDIAKNTLKQIISMFLTNRITLSLGLSVGGGVAGAAAAGSGGIGGIGLLGSIGGVAGSFLSGASGLFTSLTGAGGGLAAAGTYLSSVLGSATTSIGAFAAAAGAVLGPLAAVAGIAAIGKALFGRKLKDVGIEGRYSGGEFTGNTYQFYKGGLFRSDKTRRGSLDAATALIFEEALDATRASIGGMAASLGGSEGLLDAFSTSIKFSTRGLSKDQIDAKIREQFGIVADQMAASVFGSALDAVARAGETASETLARLSTALTTANTWLDRLGQTAYSASLAGGDLSSRWADLFGGIEGMSDAVGAYYNAFYSDGERLAQARRELGEALNVLGINTMPGSNRAFRALVDEAFGAGDTDLAAQLIQLAPAMAAITEQAQAMTDALRDLDRQSLFSTAAERLYAATSEGYRAARAEGVTVEMLRELIAAVREGNINLSRLSSLQLAELQRAALDPAA